MFASTGCLAYGKSWKICRNFVFELTSFEKGGSDSCDFVTNCYGSLESIAKLGGSNYDSLNIAFQQFF